MSKSDTTGCEPPDGPTDAMVLAGIEAIRAFGGSDFSPPSDDQCKFYVLRVWDAMMEALHD